MRSIIPENFKSLSLVVSEKNGGHEKPEIGRISRPEVNFEKIIKKYQLHVIISLPCKFQRNRPTHLWEIGRTKVRKIIIIIIIITIFWNQSIELDKLNNFCCICVKKIFISKKLWIKMFKNFVEIFSSIFGSRRALAPFEPHLWKS